MLERTIQGRVYRKSTFSGAGNDCIGLPVGGKLNAVADTKTDGVLSGNAAALVNWVKTINWRKGQ